MRQIAFSSSCPAGRFASLLLGGKNESKTTNQTFISCCFFLNAYARLQNKIAQGLSKVGLKEAALFVSLMSVTPTDLLGILLGAKNYILTDMKRDFQCLC